MPETATAPIPKKAPQVGSITYLEGPKETFAPITFTRTVYGELASKSNSRKIVIIGGRPAVIKSAKARAYCADFMRQVGRRLNPIFTCDVVLKASVYYASQRPDLDIALLMDCLQFGSEKHPMANIISNDRQVKELHVFHGIDKVKPRVEFEIYPRKVISKAKGGMA